LVRLVNVKVLYKVLYVLLQSHAMKKDSKLCNFRLSSETVECLGRLSDQWSCSMTEAVERALLIAEAAVIAAPETTGEPVREHVPPKPSTPKVSGRAESVAQRKAREAKEHALKLAEADVTARMTGRDDIEYDLENVPHQSALHVALQKPETVKHHYEVQEREAKPLARPHGSTEAKRRREQ
jgi:hypothetical protein